MREEDRKERVLYDWKQIEKSKMVCFKYTSTLNIYLICIEFIISNLN